MSTSNDSHALEPHDPPLRDRRRHPVLPAHGLRLLLDAYRWERELEADEWEFAVEIRCLNAAGLTNTHLRWILHRGYALHGVEQTQPGASRRTFRRVSNLSLPEATCFVLTDAGAAYALGCAGWCVPGVTAHQGRQSPVWDALRRELRVGQVIVKRFKQPAASQELVLGAFEEEGWPPRIDDPLPPEAEQDPKRRLHSTISNLNRGQREIRVHFAGGGEGQSVCWCLLGPGQYARTERRQSECSGPKRRPDNTN
jgi:hypothetical protein